jgi:UDP-N-acetylmuramoylalanine-D-glutamate ligase
MKERKNLMSMSELKIHSVPSVEEAVQTALEHASKGDRILFSPGFSAGGLDRSRTERGERFVKAVKSL